MDRARARVLLRVRQSAPIELSISDLCRRRRQRPRQKIARLRKLRRLRAWRHTEFIYIVDVVTWRRSIWNNTPVAAAEPPPVTRSARRWTPRNAAAVLTPAAATSAASVAISPATYLSTRARTGAVRDGSGRDGLSVRPLSYSCNVNIYDGPYNGPHA